MINSSITKIKMCPADVAATIVDGKEEPAGQAGESPRSAKPGIQVDHQRPHIDGAAADAGQWRRENVPDALVGLRWQESSFPYRKDHAVRQRVRQAAQLQTGTRGELEVAAAELTRNPAQPPKRRTGRLPARNPNPDDGAILCQMEP
jgi:hypothetical protein